MRNFVKLLGLLTFVMIVLVPSVMASNIGKTHAGVISEGCDSRADYDNPHTYQCYLVRLQIVTAQAIELRTWKGAELNYQQAQADWSKTQDALSEELSSVYWSYRQGLPENANIGTKTTPARRLELKAEARHSVTIYQWHILKLMRDGRVSLSDARNCLSLSNRLRLLLV